MGFFERIRAAAGRFMMGRNGMDALNTALLWAYVALYLLRAVLGVIIQSLLLRRMLAALYSAAAVVLIFRALSRNLPRRQEENRKWLSWQRRVRQIGSGIMSRRADKDHRYFTCKSCGTVCRVPAGKGRIVITCPRCGAKIQAKS